MMLLVKSYEDSQGDGQNLFLHFCMNKVYIYWFKNLSTIDLSSALLLAQVRIFTENDVKTCSDLGSRKSVSATD